METLSRIETLATMLLEEAARMRNESGDQKSRTPRKGKKVSQAALVNVLAQRRQNINAKK